MKELAKKGEKINLHANYIIQYYGVVLDGKKWIVCSITEIRALRASDEDNGLAATLEGLLTSPYEEWDSDTWFDAFYDPSAGKLSESKGMLTAEPARKPGTDEKHGTAEDSKSPVEQPDDPFKQPEDPFK